MKKPKQLRVYLIGAGLLVCLAALFTEPGLLWLKAVSFLVVIDILLSLPEI